MAKQADNQPSAASAEGKGKIPPEIKALRSRKVYIQLRVPRIKEELKTLGEQRKKLSEAKGRPESLTKDHHQQRVYAHHELERLKAELKNLEKERGTILGKLRGSASETASVKSSAE